jgi:membrane protease YdiL (CAAX protease family)
MIYGPQSMPQGSDWVWLLLLAPLLEETVFRAMIQQQLASWWSGPWGMTASILCASGLFALLHAFHQGALGLLVFFPSLVLGYLWHQNRSLTQCIALHAGMNACFWLTVATH